jgi:malonyl CoA-acyl carrier protein transacylase
MKAGLFPGQGIPAQTVLESLPAEHRVVVAASKILGYDLRRRVKNSATNRASVLPTCLAQPAIFTASIIGWCDSLPGDRGCDFLLGHSLGEYSALTAAGAMSFEHGLCVVAVRGKAMEAAGRAQPGRMMAVLSLGDDDVARISAASGAVIANDNAPGQVVLSGPERALSDAAELVRAAKGRAVLLDVSGPFHTPAMAAAERELADVLDHISIRNPSIPVVSNVTGEPYRAPGEIRKMLVHGLATKVCFQDCLKYLWHAGVRDLWDAGPGYVALGLARRNFEHLAASAEPVHA